MPVAVPIDDKVVLSFTVMVSVSKPGANPSILSAIVSPFAKITVCPSVNAVNAPLFLLYWHVWALAMLNKSVPVLPTGTVNIFAEDVTEQFPGELLHVPEPQFDGIVHGDTAAFPPINPNGILMRSSEQKRRIVFLYCGM